MSQAETRAGPGWEGIWDGHEVSLWQLQEAEEGPQELQHRGQLVTRVLAQTEAAGALATNQSLILDQLEAFILIIDQLQVARSLSSEMTDSGLGQDAKNVNLSRQKLLKGDIS